jgi:fructose-1-phosphate kinase PfkB-like protein
VILNAALDKIYHIGELTLGAAHRARRRTPTQAGRASTSRALASAGVAVLATDLGASSTGRQIEKSWRCRTPFTEAFRNVSECVLPQACDQ